MGDDGFDWKSAGRKTERGKADTARSQTGPFNAAHDRPAQIRAYLQLGQTELKDAENAWRVIADDVDGLLDQFYAEALRSELLPALTECQIARLKASQKCHWARLFSSDGADRVVWDRARRMGLRHRQHELTPFVFTMSYMRLLTLFLEALRRSGGAEARDLHRDCTVITKVVALDLALALGAYDAELID